MNKITSRSTNGPLAVKGSIHLSDVTLREPLARDITFTGDHGPLLTIKPDGTIEIGEGLSTKKATQKAATLLVEQFYKLLDTKLDAAIARAKKAEAEAKDLRRGKSGDALTLIGFIGQPQLGFISVNESYRKTCIYSYDYTAGSVPLFVLTETLNHVRNQHQRTLQANYEKPQ